MRNCYICESPITDENSTFEHILLNSIGGRLKSITIICRDCNSQLGEEIDTALSNQLSFIANMLNIKRERGVPQKVIGQAASGEEIYMEPGGKPAMTKPIFTIDEDQKRITIITHGKKGLRKQLNGLKKKYPEIDVDHIMDHVEVKSEYLKETYHFDHPIGGSEAFRSICKTVVNYYMFRGGDRAYIQHLVDYIRHGGNQKVVSFYYTENEIIPKNSGDVWHSILLKGDATNRLLYGYVELFNAYRFLVLLHDDYRGVDFAHSYIFDLLHTREVDQQVNLNLSQEEVLNIMSSSLPTDAIQTRLNQLMTIIYKKQDSEHIQQLLDRALEKSLKKYPEGTVITPEMADELVEKTMEEITPWIIHRLREE